MMQENFIKLEQKDGSTYFKRIDEWDKVEREYYYEGIEADLLNKLGNEDWYVYRLEHTEN